MHEKKQENIALNKPKSYSIETDPKITQKIELVYKVIRTT